MTLSFAPEAVAQWPLARLRLYAANARIHDASQVARIAASIVEYGWTVPVLVADDGEVIAGHGRILAAEMLGLAEVPVIMLDHLSEEQRRAYRLADNKLTELGGWDELLRGKELRVLPWRPPRPMSMWRCCAGRRKRCARRSIKAQISCR